MVNGWIKTAILLCIMPLVASCGAGEGGDDSALAAKIEQQVQASRPDMDFDQYEHFYAHEPLGLTTAVYVIPFQEFGTEDSQAGQVHWVSPSELPAIDDGGCNIITVRYHAFTDTMLDISCNGRA